MKKLQVKIEIPLNSNIKYEYDYKTNTIVVDRILREGFRYPANYGCVTEALDWDGDPLDVLVYSSHEFTPGSVVHVRLVGAMQMIDEGETDTKLIGVHADDYKLEAMNSLADLPQDFLAKLKNFFEHYKDWKGTNVVQVPGFKGEEWANAEYEACIELMKKYGSMDKDAFIAKMKVEHPEKYVI